MLIHTPGIPSDRKASCVGTAKEFVFLHDQVGHRNERVIIQIRVSRESCIEIVANTLLPKIGNTRMKRRTDIDRNRYWEMIAIKEIIRNLKRREGVTIYRTQRKIYERTATTRSHMSRNPGIQQTTSI